MWSKIRRATGVALQAAIVAVMKWYMAVGASIVAEKKVGTVIEAASVYLKR